MNIDKVLEALNDALVQKEFTIWLKDEENKTLREQRNKLQDELDELKKRG